MENKNKKVLIISIIALILVVAGASYAYFSARITGLESASTLSMTAGTLGIHYAEGNEEVSMNNIYPKEDEWLTKTFTLTGNNTTELKMKYKVGLNIINNEFTSDALTYVLTHETVTNGKAISEQTGRRIKSGTNVKQYFGEGYFTNTNGTGIDHEYELKIYFKDNGLDQNINQGKVFNAKIFVEEGSVIPVNKCYTDDYNGTTTDVGTTYETEQYIYTYKQGYGEGFETVTLTEDGWSVISKQTMNNIPLLMSSEEEEPSLEDLEADPITEAVCTSVNDKPIVNMNAMYALTGAQTIDLSSLDTSNVTEMGAMFGLSQVPLLDLSSFDTSNVTDMEGMFQQSQAVTLDLSSFDTSKVTNMRGMFQYNQATSLDLSSFDTSNVTDMTWMFADSQSTSLDLSSFDTSNVTDMYEIFAMCQATTLDLSSFDTSNVTTMENMFSGMPNLSTIYASNKFVTTALTYSTTIFSDSYNLVGGNGTHYDSNHIDDTY
ncbi:MAG TPA: hypothetical protein DCL29_01110, partial [Eubacterium sp.]|nr:hypothetical protein [Eubacterium sp.]